MQFFNVYSVLTARSLALTVAVLLLCGPGAAAERAVGSHEGHPWIDLEPRDAIAGEVPALCAQPLALASGDLDEDGVPDLIVACADSEGGGAVVVYRGREEAIYPRPGTAGESVAPFAAAAHGVHLTNRAEWIGTGDFDGDGHLDVAAAARAGRSLQLLRGSGDGELAAPETIALPGPVLDLVAGEINRRDGSVDLVVAVAAGDDSRLLVFEGRHGDFGEEPESIAVPGRVVDLALGQLDGHFAHDLAVATDRGLTLVYGRDRAFASAPYMVEHVPVDSGLAAVAVGDFLAGPNSWLEIAGLTGDGRLQLVSSGGREGAHGRDCDDSRCSTWQVVATRTVRKGLGAVGEAAGFELSVARVSSLPFDEVVILDPQRSRVLAMITEGQHHIKSVCQAITPPGSLGLSAVPMSVRDYKIGSVVKPTAEFRWPPFEEAVVVGEGAAPVAVLPMRLNPDAIDDLVVLERGRREPKVLVSAFQATFEVNSTADTDDGSCDADCTLREAITAANLATGADMISFNIPGTPPHMIQPLTDLPQITEAVTIDGTTEPDFVDTPVVVLDGSSLSAAAPSGIGLLVSGGSSTVRGLACNGFTLNSCITVWLGGGNIIEGNFLGTDAAGAVAVGTLAGTNAVASSNNTFGGTTVAARNIIAGTTVPAIELREGSNDNTLQGNFIGLDVSGTVNLRNAGNDLVIYDSQRNTFGGTAVAERNVVTGGPDPGLLSIGIATNDTDPLTSTQDNLVQGNFLGTDATGNVGMGTASAAVYILDAPANTIGGAAGNVIADAGLWGVAAVLAGATDNLVDGNFIGVGADGVTALPNASNGVHLYVDAALTTVSNNTVANNLENGVGLRSDCGSGNTISGNSIFANGLLGIDLDLDGVTTNDLLDPDVGANLLQNHPVVLSADAATNTVTGTLNSTASSSFTIELFASTTCDESGHGEGEVFLGSGAVMTDVDGNGVFSIAVTPPLIAGGFVTATATETAGSTSEFSPCREIPLFADGFESGDMTRWSGTVP